MKKEFQDYLINQGYSIKTPSGNPSTVYDYQKRIDKVCEWEGYTWETLANNIGRIVVMYDIGGAKENLKSAAKALVAGLQAHITANYYTCTDEILAGLGQMYVADERFKKNIDKYGDGTAEFVSEGIRIYVEKK